VRAAMRPLARLAGNGVRVEFASPVAIVPVWVEPPCPSVGAPAPGDLGRRLVAAESPEAQCWWPIGCRDCVWCERGECVLDGSRMQKHRGRGRRGPAGGSVWVLRAAR